MTPMIMISIMVVIMLLGLSLLFRKKSHRKPMDYYQFFIMGIVWLAIGIPLAISAKNYGLLGMGIGFTIAGLVNHDKWDKNRQHFKDLDPKVRRTTDALDSVGNTTKAICKGFAISDAGFETIALFLVFMLHANLDTVLLTTPSVIIGLFIGGVLPFVFSGLCLQAVGKTAFLMVEEIRRQFREISGLKEGRAKPDYTRCVDISTSAALRNLVAPGLITIAIPLIVRRRRKRREA